MLYPQNIEQKLGFDKIKELLADHCISSLGRAFVDKIKFSDKHTHIVKLLNQASEFKYLLQIEGSFLEQNYLDCHDSLTKANIEGAFLPEGELFNLKLSLKTIAQILHFFKEKGETYPNLQELAEGVSLEQNILKEIDRIIDERGNIRDNASPELVVVRQRLNAEKNNLRRSLDTLLRHAKNSGWVGDEVSLTVRGGRMVIPVLAEHKRKIKGFVHDESATGQMVFLEPTEVLEANNEIRDLEAKEKREIVKILEKITQFIRPHVADLRRCYTFLGLVDFIKAKAKLALKLDASAPQIKNERVLQWLKAQHPVLKWSFQASSRVVIPLSVKLNQENRILVVSGPNAGGKSVMLKTIGLLQYMLQCGLLVTVSPDSQMGVFKNIFIDIGDEQSLENDLSTYSSHLSNMKHFLHFADKHTLFLIDEFGTGTDPNLGGAIAESILDNLQKTGAMGVVNTHYANLKVFADKETGLLNGAMKFDAEHLAPLYELEMGQPGSSFALEVAQKIGLPATIIQQAKRKLNRELVDFEKISKELEIEKKVFRERNTELIQRNQELTENMGQYQGLKNYLETEKKRLLNEAKLQAKEVVKEANRKIEATIREIKEAGAEKEATRKIRESLKEYEKKELIIDNGQWITNNETTIPNSQFPIPSSPQPEEKEEIFSAGIELGAFVQIKGQKTVGEVLSIKGKDAEIRIGELKSNVKLNRLERISKKVYRETTGETNVIKTRLGGIDMNEKMSNFSFNLDLRGKRGDEALTAVDNLMNDALLLSYPELRIVHGKGDGILRTLVRNHLKKYKEVKAMSDEHADRGGAGVTVVSMR